jgi:hypothetical protein
MDNIPIEYRARMLAEQMAMMEAFEFIAQLLIYFALLVAFVILILEIARIARICFYHSKSKVENFRKAPLGEFQKGSAR